MITSLIHRVKKIEIHKPYELNGGNGFVQNITVTCYSYPK